MSYIIIYAASVIYILSYQYLYNAQLNGSLEILNHYYLLSLCFLWWQGNGSELVMLVHIVNPLFLHHVYCRFYPSVFFRSTVENWFRIAPSTIARYIITMHSFKDGRAQCFGTSKQQRCAWIVLTDPLYWPRHLENGNKRIRMLINIPRW